MKYFVTFSLTQTNTYTVDAMSPQDAIDMIYDLPQTIIKGLSEDSPDFIFHSIEDANGRDYPIERFDCDY